MTPKKKTQTHSHTAKAGKARDLKSEYNGWRALIVFVEGIFNLINNNKIYPAFALLVISIAGLIVWRLPESELAEIVKLLINEIIVGKGGLIGLLIATNVGWFYLFNKMKKIYKEEIDRLAHIRSELMHGSNKKIEVHRSINDECRESYILPASDNNKHD